MASNINPYSIDGTYPIANQDNSSQGFRDNFTNIQNNFITASAEISDLQSKVITTSALTGQTLNNDMSGAILTRPQLNAWSETVQDLGTISGTATLDYTQANFQKITSAGAITLNLINWPGSASNASHGYGRMRIMIVITQTAHTLTLPNSVVVGQNELSGFNPATNTITFDATGTYVFDLSSYDSGNSYLIFDLTRNKSLIHGNLIIDSTNGSTSSYVPAHSNSAGTAGQVAWDNYYWYVCVGTNTWLRTSLSTW